MGGCATKPKVTKDNAPEPAEEDTPKAITDDVIDLEKKAAQEPKTQDYTEKPKVDEVVHDDMTDTAEVDQAKRRRSLSSLFQDNQVSVYLLFNSTIRHLSLHFPFRIIFTMSTNTNPCRIGC